MSGQGASSNVAANTSSNDASKPEVAIAEARRAIGELLDGDPSLRPHCIRIAFYDAISYNPIAKVDGPKGSIRIWEGLAQDEEMKKAIGELDKLKANLKSNLGQYISYADLYQLAGIVAIEKVGGPRIEFRHGRTDSCIPSKLPIIKEDAKAEFVKEKFHRIGFTDKEIVALFSAYYYWMNYTQMKSQLNMDNSYYQKLLDVSKPKETNAGNTSSNPPIDRQPIYSSLLAEATSSTPQVILQLTGRSTPSTPHYWECLLSDASFRKHVELFNAMDKDKFAKEYATAHQKLSELGFKYFPEPILTEAEHHDIKHGIAFAVAMTILFGFVGFFYEAMRA